MWTNNIDVFRDYLIVPVERNKINDIENNSDTNAQIMINQTDNTINNNNNANYKDYLEKFDTFLNESKEKLKNLESITR